MKRIIRVAQLQMISELSDEMTPEVWYQRRFTRGALYIMEDILEMKFERVSTHGPYRQLVRVETINSIYILVKE